MFADHTSRYYSYYLAWLDLHKIVSYSHFTVYIEEMLRFLAAVWRDGVALDGQNRCYFLLMCVMFNTSLICFRVVKTYQTSRKYFQKNKLVQDL